MKSIHRSARPGRLACIALAALLANACRSGADAAPEPSAPASATAVTVPTGSTTAAPSGGRPRLLDAPPQGSVESAVKVAWEGAVAERRRLVVYVGAVWCEPCQRFRRALEQGELDAMFPNVTFLEFDLDLDRERLASAGYVSKLIPLFALPTATGVASGKQIEGGIKGDGAVGFIAPRLRAMLAQ